MPNKFTPILLTSMILVSGTVYSSKNFAADNDASAIKEIQETEKIFAGAVLRNDQAVLASMLSDDFLDVNGNGSINNKKADLERYEKRKFSIFNIDEMKVRVLGTTGIVTGTTSYKTGTLSGSVSFTDVLVKRENKWQFVSSHYSYIMPAAK